MRKPIALIIFVLILTSLTPGFVGSQETAEKKWTIIMYMGGDGHPDDISEEVRKDLQEVMDSDPIEDINVIALCDMKGSNDSKLYFVEDCLNEIPIIEINNTWKHELDFTDPYVINQYVKWAIEKYPADKYMLDIWGHGSSLDGMPLEDGELLSIPEIDSGLGGIKVDILGFDACTLGLVEIYYELREHADIIIASEMEETIEGWPYYKLMEDLNSNPDIEAKQFAEKIINDFVQWGKYNSGVSSSLTAIDTSKIPIEKIVNYFDAIQQCLPFYHGEIKNARKNTEKYQPEPIPIDLYHFSRMVEKNVPLMDIKIKGEILREGINESIIAHDFYSVSTGSSAENSHGYGIYFPTREIEDKYSSLEFYERSVDETLDEINKIEYIPEYKLFTKILDSSDSNLNISIENKYENSITKIKIYQGNTCIADYDFQGKKNYLNLSLSPMQYTVDVLLFQDNLLLNHTTNLVTVNSIFSIKGDISSENSVDINIRNNRTGMWKNFTVEPGKYDITLHQPTFCKPGDKIFIEYKSKGSSETEFIEVNENEINKDVNLNIWFSFNNWMLFIQILMMLILIILFLKHYRYFNQL